MNLRPIDQPARCHQCLSPLDSPIGCLNCHTIFPASSELTHFDRLGLEPRYDLSIDELNRRYLAWSRELHPDFHQTKGPEDQSMSLRLCASLNDAYATLKDPARRAEYLLRLHGGPSASELRDMPQGFLEEVLEWKLQIDEAREDAQLDSPAIGDLKRRIDGARRTAMEQVARTFHDVGASRETAQREQLREIRKQLNSVKYFDGLLRELTA